MNVLLSLEMYYSHKKSRSISPGLPAISTVQLSPSPSSSQQQQVYPNIQTSHHSDDDDDDDDDDDEYERERKVSIFSDCGHPFTEIQITQSGKEYSDQSVNIASRERLSDDYDTIMNSHDYHQQQQQQPFSPRMFSRSASPIRRREYSEDRISENQPTFATPENPPTFHDGIPTRKSDCIQHHPYFSSLSSEYTLSPELAPSNNQNNAATTTISPPKHHDVHRRNTNTSTNANANTNTNTNTCFPQTARTRCHSESDNHPANHNHNHNHSNTYVNTNASTATSHVMIGRGIVSLSRESGLLRNSRLSGGMGGGQQAERVVNSGMDGHHMKKLLLRWVMVEYNLDDLFHFSPIACLEG